MSSDTSIPPRPGSGAARRQAIAKKKSQPGGKNPLVIVGAIVALIAVALLIAVVAGGGGDDDTVATEDATGLQEVRPVTVTGDALPDFAQTDGDTAVGLTAPTIEGATFNGIEMSLPVQGSPTLLVYLAHWCPHCQVEVPLLTEWDADGGVPAGVEIFGIATATDEAAVNYPPSLWLEEEGFPFAVMADSEDADAGQAMGVTGYPAFVMVDAEGKVAWRASGELPIDQLQAMVEASLPAA